ncbi:Ger(x)C family spore germination protein [Paramaledivibacter caminithermalis]|jgi:spore germination protein KC|uniref:Spore germination protein KC n=1 Tax=Paramaledivibacter caminithermalis (strain DSM 15212 / CIP 107654 / DViRD3) TaxID=1121301 RepID=A0A1M6P9C9_PARC5|nr:Ger(x)C family spore germination protein [Paramaledivibacter caminithermalis]SHK04571.1 spore germination protein KC [Paramaledivibacter caminithermalis DSM 15212]
MKKLYFIIIVITLFILSGCWNYSDVNKMRFVAGVAIDYDESKDKYIVTSEVVKLLEGGQRFGSALFQSRGETVFDAVRDTIMKNARKLYWGHTKVIILSKDVTGKRLVPILDYISRDGEFRDNVWILISDEDTANEIFENTFENRDEITSFHIDDTLKNEKNISTYHAIPAWRFIGTTYDKGASPTLPMVIVAEKDGIKVPKVRGQAIIKGSNLVGTLDETETKIYLWIINELEGGVLTVKTEVSDRPIEVTLELFANKTRIKPIKSGDEIVIKINIESDFGIGEISGEVNVIEKKAREVLKRDTEAEIKKQMENVIKKVQKEYKSDIFGFGIKIKDKMPEKWRQIEPYWDEVFKDLETEINVNVNIRGSALTLEPIKIED